MNPEDSRPLNDKFGDDLKERTPPLWMGKNHPDKCKIVNISNRYVNFEVKSKPHSYFFPLLLKVL